MPRRTQFIGHSRAAKTLMEKHKFTPISKIGVATGTFGGEVADLFSYRSEEGEVWEEFVQYKIWSSGSHGLLIFTALKNQTTQEVVGWSRRDPNPWVYKEFDAAQGDIYI